MLLEIKNLGDKCTIQSDNKEIALVIKQGIQALVYSLKINASAAESLLANETSLFLSNGSSQLEVTENKCEISKITSAIDKAIFLLMDLNEYEDNDEFLGDDFDCFDEEY